MTPDEIRRKIDELQMRSKQVGTKKATFNGQLQAKKEELASLIKDIRAAGYDPKNLVAERDRAQAELEKIISDFEVDLKKAEDALSGYEKK